MLPLLGPRPRRVIRIVCRAWPSWAAAYTMAAPALQPAHMHNGCAGMVVLVKPAA
ncbi:MULTISPECIES: hypothetical protein [Komagataeibacter]|uniref:hypothetical protein n=1 Tax=Komagataeibacter TaxID=1434011 RepID=UPI0013C36148|nr:hypothetical protein [Komagataeibacter saccharivorans]